MPPGKRGRPPGKSAASQPATKRVRVGETSVIGEQSSTEVPASGRLKRSSASEPNYSVKRAKAPTTHQANTNTKSPGKSTTKATSSRGRFSATPASEPLTTDVPKRGRGRPRKLDPTKKALVQEDVTKPTRIIGRPRKDAKKRAGRPKKAVEEVEPAKPAKLAKQAKPAKPAKPAKTVKTPLAVRKGHVAKEDDEEESEKFPNGASSDVDDGEETESGRQYWLMKAEPDSRMHKGVDVKFSIDDLRAIDGGEAWDGVRNIAARNNMRAMRKGDLAFFYHSSCIPPGIVGIMEIVGEHQVDESAFDPKHPYFDPDSSRANPKWDAVYVSFVRKFDMIKLSKLKKFSEPGGDLENMQTIQQPRLSVSAVKPKEWYFILDLADVNPSELENEVAEAAEIAEKGSDGDTNQAMTGGSSVSRMLVDGEAGEDIDEEEEDGDKNDDVGGEDEAEDEDEAEGVNGHDE